MSSVFGEKNDSIYKLQYTFSNKYIADSVLFAPEPLGTIAIDSKFPLEHYQLMVDKSISQAEREKYEKLFKMDVKKHIDAIDLLVGPDELYVPFQNYFDKRQSLLNQNVLLLEARDRLLPRLMSGEVEV